MKVWVASVLVWVASSGMAYAQLRPPAEPNSGYVSVVGQSSFGNVTSRSFGAEAGIVIAPQFQIVAEVGRVFDAADKSVGVSAQTIADQVFGQSNGAVTYAAKVPVSFATGAIKFVLPIEGKLKPYVLGGFGAAQVTRNVRFRVGGADITDSLSQAPYFITLGSDLSGSQIKPLFAVGAGLVIPLTARLFADLDFRYNKVFNTDVQMGRGGLGIGLRF